jgi:hypothetical protein
MYLKFLKKSWAKFHQKYWILINILRVKKLLLKKKQKKTSLIKNLGNLFVTVIILNLWLMVMMIIWWILMKINLTWIKICHQMKIMNQMINYKIWMIWMTWTICRMITWVKILCKMNSISTKMNTMVNLRNSNYLKMVKVLRFLLSQ